MPLSFSACLRAVAALALVIMSLTGQPALAEQNFSAAQEKAIGELVRQYLLNNPEVLREAMIELERRDTEAQTERQKLVIQDHADDLFNAPGDFVIGNPEGDVTLVEFFDYNCGFCKRALSDLTRLIDNDPNLRVVMKEFPILSEGSAEAARLSLAAGAQGKYFEFHQALLNARGQANGARALSIAETVGLDVARLKEDADKPEVKEAITSSLRLASALGVNGTPSYVVGDEVVVGAVGYDELKKKIDEARARLAKSD